MIFFDFLKIKFCLKSNPTFRTIRTHGTDPAVAGLETFLCETKIIKFYKHVVLFRGNLSSNLIINPKLNLISPKE